jgi:hypothetical protein
VSTLRRTLGACGVALALLAGCSGGDDKDAASDSSVPPSSVAPATTVRPVDTSFTGQNSAQFCTLAKTYTDRFSSVGTNPSPAQLRTLVREGQTAITQAVNAAPAEIKRDVELLATTFSGLIAEMEKVNYEVARVPPAALSQLSTPEFQTSTTRFQTYIRSVCGITG